MSDTPTFLTGTELLLQELTAERAKVAQAEQERDNHTAIAASFMIQLEAAESQAARLREAVQLVLSDEYSPLAATRWAAIRSILNEALQGEPK